MSFLDLFAGQRQLIIQHFMFDPSWEEGCSSCSADCDETSEGSSGTWASEPRPSPSSAECPTPRSPATGHNGGGPSSSIRRAAVTSITTSTPPWMSREPRWRSTTGPGPTWRNQREQSSPGPSTRSSRSRSWATASSGVTATPSSTPTPARGTESCTDRYGLLDLTALGRQEDWEEPKDRADDPYGASPDIAPKDASA
jgi:hypothetical protein